MDGITSLHPCKVKTVPVKYLLTFQLRLKMCVEMQYETVLKPSLISKESKYTLKNFKLNMKCSRVSLRVFILVFKLIC